MRNPERKANQHNVGIKTLAILAMVLVLGITSLPAHGAGIDLGYARREGSSWVIDYVTKHDGSYSVELALDSADRPHIAYGTNDRRLEYASFDEGSWSFDVFDNRQAAVAYLAIDGDDTPHISYFYDGRVNYATHSGSTWTHQGVGSGDPGPIVLDSAGSPHISYRRTSPHDGIRYATYDGLSWSGETAVAEDGLYVAFALSSDNTPHIAYTLRFASDPDLLRYATYDGSSWSVQTVGSCYGWTHPSIVTDSVGNPHIAYEDENRELIYTTYDGSSWLSQTVDSSGRLPSLVLDTDDRPHMSYTSGDGVVYGKHDGSSWVFETIDKYGTSVSSLKLDSSGNPHVGYVSRAYIPEPTSLSLLALGVLALMRRKRK